MTRKNAHLVAPPNGEDIINCLLAVREDLCCEGRIILRLAAGDSRDLLCTVEVYRDDGTPIGVSREVGKWYPAHRFSLLGYLVGSIHKAYHTACDLAHAYPKGTTKSYK